MQKLNASVCGRDHVQRQIPLSQGFSATLPNCASTTPVKYHLLITGMSYGNIDIDTKGGQHLKKREFEDSDERTSKCVDAILRKKYHQLLLNWDAETDAKFNMMNGNLHLKTAAADAQGGVAMETNCEHGRKIGCKKNLINEQQQMLEQLNGMSLSERRLTNGLAPRITLTSVDADDVGHDMMDDSGSEEYDHGGLTTPKFLTVPKLQEVGKERRPPVMVKTV